VLSITDRGELGLADFGAEIIDNQRVEFAYCSQ
jgi:hypothetical protein